MKNLSTMIVAATMLATPAMAQVSLRGQTIAPSADPCEDPHHEDFGFLGRPKKTSDMLACSDYANGRHDYVAFLKWLTMASEGGNWFAQDKLANVYSSAVWAHDVSQNYIASYKWYDVSAAVKGECIDRLPPAQGGVAYEASPETNEWQIKWRDEVAKKMAAKDIALAQTQSKAWINAPHHIVCPTNQSDGTGGG